MERVEGRETEVSKAEVTSRADDVGKEVEKAMLKAARMIGGSVAGHAIDQCPVDTGLLRNSITFAIGGEPPAVTDYQSDEKDKNGEYTTGHYDGEAPQDDDDEVTVYVGTNVQYAPYQELGAPNAHVPEHPFLRPAFENNKREIEQILEKCLREVK